MAKVFFGLPDHLKINLLDEWLSLPLVCLFHDRIGDIIQAVKCNQRCREDMARVLASPECVLQCRTHHEPGKMLSWIVEHNIKVRCVTVCFNDLQDESYRAKIVTHLAPTLTDLTFNFVSAQDIADEQSGAVDDEFFDDQEGCDYEGAGSMLTQIVNACTHLTHLTLERLVSSYYLLGLQLPQSIGSVLSQCRNLEYLSLYSRANVNASIVQAMCALPNLKHIDTQHSDTFIDDAFDLPLTSRSVRKVSTRGVQLCLLFPLLEEVRLDGITSADVLLMSQRCIHIISATLHLADNITPSVAEAVCKNWKHVRVLFLNTADTMAEGSVIVFIAQCPSLQTLQVASEEFYHFQSSVVPCVYPSTYQGSRLRELRIYCGTERLMDAIVSNCKYLHSLHIYGSPVYERSMLDVLHKLNDTTVRDLQIEGCNALSDRHVSALCKLETIKISRIRNTTLTNQGIIDMARNCTTLRSLQLSSIESVSPSVGLDVVRLCPVLHTYTYWIGRKYDTTHVMFLDMVKSLLRECYPHVKKFAIGNVCDIVE